SKIVKILIAVFAVCLIAPAFSAVENVKVGGDIAVWGVLRGEFVAYNKLYTGFSQARVYVSADLSENVQTMVRLINERVWDSTKDNLKTGISLDLAYIKVSDLLAPGLSITLGRQEIELGEGLVVGSRYHKDLTNYPGLSALTDLGLQKAFDAVRIDYGAEGLPIQLTAFYSQIKESGNNPDEKLFGVDLGVGVADLAKVDLYYVGNIEKREGNVDDIYTFGLRTVIGVPAVSGLSLKAEYAKQFKDSKGWALLAGIKYESETNLKPWVKLNYARFSDEWTDIYPSNIASRVGPTLYASGNALNNSTLRNLNTVNLGVGISPAEKWAVSLDTYWVDRIGANNTLGYDVNLGIEYKHTEDLTFGLTGGKVFAGDLDKKPWQILSYAKIAF
ncbi:MAG: hypothetical protein NC827_09820, partial [Candidatus Omnitrophica bacterium]|nr:hypothetical protein [Candidatus Omnitrophota bacterium]